MQPLPLVTETTCGGQSADDTFKVSPPPARTRVDVPPMPPFDSSGPSGSQPQLYPPSHFTGRSVTSSASSVRSGASSSTRYGETLTLGDVATQATHIATGAVAVLHDQEGASPTNRALLSQGRDLAWVTHQNEQQLTNRCAALKNAGVRAMKSEEELRGLAADIALAVLDTGRK